MPFWTEGLATVVEEVYGDHPMQPRPGTFRWKNQTFRVEGIGAYWRTQRKWWTGDDTWRDYWQVTAQDGLMAWLFYDQQKSEWYLERVDGGP